MAKSFGQYTGGIEASTGNLVQASTAMAKQTYDTFAGIGQNLAEGLKAYNDNSAKNDILTAEAEQLGIQIQQFQAQFGDSPEHQPFAQSLTPHIQQLAKIPSMSLTQKMGVLTGVKAAFGNIGQQLQVFELMRKERMSRDINTAKGNITEFDLHKVPHSVVPSGKLPYFHNKSYTQNEDELVRLAKEAQANGANLDISSVLNEWRKGIKADAVSRNDMPPAVKEALLKQLGSAEGLQENIQTEDGVTDYSKEAEMYASASTSVKEQLAPPPQEVTNKDSSSKYNKIEDLKNSIKKISTLSSGAKKMGDTDVYDKTIVALSVYKNELAKLEKAEAKENRSANVITEAKKELISIEEKLKVLAEKNDDGDTPRKTITSGFGNFIARNFSNAATATNNLLKKEALIASDTNLDDPEAIRKFLISSDEIVNAAKETGKGILRFINPIDDFTSRTVTKNQEKSIDGILAEQTANKKMETARSMGDTETELSLLKEKKTELENRIKTGIPQATAADISKAEKAPAEKTTEEDYVLTNKYNLGLGTKNVSVPTSIENKRKDMEGFFMKKYGYIPASFEDTFKSVFPEANFRTMETPYGVFMHDGKDWKQIQVQQPVVRSRKEQAEEKSVSFGKELQDGTIDTSQFHELVPNSGIFLRGIYAGSPTDASKFRLEMLETSNARYAVNRLVEINDMVGESMPWNAALWGEAKALLPQIKAGLRTDIIGVGTVSNYEQQLIEDVIADPTKFWTLESSDRAKLAEIMRRVDNRLREKPQVFGLEVKVAGRPNAERERALRAGNASKTKMELAFEAAGGKKGMYQGNNTGAKVDWSLSNKIPDYLTK